VVAPTPTTTTGGAPALHSSGAEAQGPGTPTRAVVSAEAAPGGVLGRDELGGVLFEALEETVAGERVLVLVPDRTRQVPMATVFPVVAEALHKAAAVEVMVALGTHPPLGTGEVAKLIGMSGTAPGPIGALANHAWSDPSALEAIGTIAAHRLQDIAGPLWHRSLGGDLVVRVNRRALEVDRVVIVGPTLPHEVAGFSGGAKYLFPGISGPEMIDVMHWLGALAGVLATIGRTGSPVRALIDEAAALLPTPTSLVALVTDEAGGLAAAYAGGVTEAWTASVPRAEQLHTRWVDQPYERVISCPMPIYGELWTAGKAMYKLEPAVADGGELVIYAPHLAEVSATHGRQIFAVGYHPLAYFLPQWDRFAAQPLAVLAHSSHVKGAGSYDVASATEQARIDVRLATAISPEDCRRLNLGHRPPAGIDLAAEAGRDGTLVVRRSGETLFRARQGGPG
ncbi:MAG TPA: lactate racemase domain-containing protein, partial [Acidimicrobiales bacterium]|nr:lactate racemase domain-containing protein [Acidimicrobiales bacterium]